jgi:hypothetical protein
MAQRSAASPAASSAPSATHADARLAHLKTLGRELAAWKAANAASLTALVRLNNAILEKGCV